MGSATPINHFTKKLQLLKQKYELDKKNGTIVDYKLTPKVRENEISISVLPSIPVGGELYLEWTVFPMEIR